ncbi:MAG: glycoside hydrolase family 3 C-terminal domain-containing protein [Clostridia bacterium]|nr:glycoside hydrolase family 3 C-terminal domain-containing protein [Clostridia bacterium]
MLKHGNIIEKLTVKQKISLLTDIRCFSNPEFNELGVPHIIAVDIAKKLKDEGEGLSPTVLARGWNPLFTENFIARIAESTDGEEDGRFFITPSPKPKLNPYGVAISEDPYLSGAMGSAYARGVGKNGANSYIEGLHIAKSDLEYLDKEPDRGLIRELFVKPFKTILDYTSCNGAVISAESSMLDKELLGYKDVKELLVGKHLICRPTTGEQTLDALRLNRIMTGGSASAIENAYDKYVYIKKAIEDESSTSAELEEAFNDGSAISDEMLDLAVDRLIEFADSCVRSEKNAEKIPSNSAELSNMRRIAYAQSVVLLKNEGGALPLTSGRRIAFIGDIAMRHQSNGKSYAECLAEHMGASFVGCVKGYDIDSLRNDELVAQAVELAQKADTVFVFLGDTAKATESDAMAKALFLPANQLALIDALGRFKSKVVAVLDTEYSLDMSFDCCVSGLILAPIRGMDSAHALFDVLVGAKPPMGRLTESLYYDTENYFKTLKSYKDNGRNKVGPFVGYRHYDSSGLPVRYPFGYGLSYSRVEYSGVRTANGVIRFFVKNTGRAPTCEIVQIYVGKRSSAMLRPIKSLASFIRVELQPGETREIAVDKLDLRVYDTFSGKWTVENGDYEIYIGASVSDIRLTSRLSIAGETIRPRREKPSDYLQSVSNIVSDKFTLEAGISKMKKFWKLNLIGILAIIAALCLDFYALVIENYDISLILIGINAGILLLAFAMFLISGLRKSSYKKKMRMSRENEKKTMIQQAEVKTYSAIEELFAEEFDTIEEEVASETEEKVYWDDTSRYIDSSYKVTDAFANLDGFMRERGVALSSDGAARILSAMCSSRLIISDIKGDCADSVYINLAKYLGSPIYIENVENGYLTGGNLLYCECEDGEVTETNVIQAIEHGMEHKDTVHIVVLKNLYSKDAWGLFIPYLRYFSNPQRECSVTAKDMGAGKTLPENLWFILEPADGECIGDISAPLLKSATVMRLGCSVCDETEEKTEYRSVGYYQLSHFVDYNKGRFTMNEDLWKKIDSLEAYVNAHTPYHIGNKLWLQIEKYLSVMACHEDSVDINLDIALSSNLIPEVVSALKGKVSAEEKNLLETVEQLFGEDKIPECRKAIKDDPVVVAGEKEE